MVLTNCTMPASEGMMGKGRVRSGGEQAAKEGGLEGIGTTITVITVRKERFRLRAKGRER